MEHWYDVEGFENQPPKNKEVLVEYTLAGTYYRRTAVLASIAGEKRWIVPRQHPTARSTMLLGKPEKWAFIPKYPKNNT